MEAGAGLALAFVAFAIIFGICGWLGEHMLTIFCWLTGLSALFATIFGVTTKDDIGAFIYISVKIISTILTIAAVLTISSCDVKTGSMPVILFIAYAVISIILDFLDISIGMIIGCVLVIFISGFNAVWSCGASYAEKLMVNENIVYIDVDRLNHVGPMAYEKDRLRISDYYTFEEKTRIYNDILEMSDEQKESYIRENIGESGIAFIQSELNKKRTFSRMSTPIVWDGKLMFLDVDKEDKAYSVNSDFAKNKVYKNHHSIFKMLSVKAFNMAHPGMKIGKFVFSKK